MPKSPKAWLDEQARIYYRLRSNARRGVGMRLTALQVNILYYRDTAIRDAADNIASSAESKARAFRGGE